MIGAHTLSPRTRRGTVARMTSAISRADVGAPGFPVQFQWVVKGVVILLAVAVYLVGQRSR
jgi:hypothetical protein